MEANLFNPTLSVLPKTATLRTNGTWKLFKYDRGRWTYLFTGQTWKSMILLDHAFYIGNVIAGFYATMPVTKITKTELEEGKEQIDFQTKDTFYRLVR